MFPLSCNLCDVLMCMNCVAKNKESTSRDNKNKCPNCMQKWKPRTIGKRLKEIAFDKFEFTHVCEEEAPEESLKELSSFEKFKLTDAYKEILKKQQVTKVKIDSEEE